MSEYYFTFPLAVLNGPQDGREITPLSCLEAAADCGIVNAGIGYRKNHGAEAFNERLQEVSEKRGIKIPPGAGSAKAEVLVGAEVCNVKLGGYDSAHLQRAVASADSIPTGGPLVRMKSEIFWAALYQARAEDDPAKAWPERSISWREFRILCAILSAKRNRAEYSFIGWETIQARACGFTTKDAFKAREITPKHLAPPLSRRIIRDTCDALEDLGFFARFRLSSGPRGGKMAYSFRHDRHELGKVVCDSTNFHDRARIKANRTADMQKCLELLERAKCETSVGQVVAKGRAK